MSTVTDLERKVQSLRGQLQAAEKSLNDARLAESGLVLGETILLYKGKEYLFAGVRSWVISSVPWVYGQPRNKDGKWSERVTLLYSEWTRAGNEVSGERQ